MYYKYYNIIIKYYHIIFYNVSGSLELQLILIIYKPLMQKNKISKSYPLLTCNLLQHCDFSVEIDQQKSEAIYSLIKQHLF